MASIQSLSLLHTPQPHFLPVKLSLSKHNLRLNQLFPKRSFPSIKFTPFVLSRAMPNTQQNVLEIVSGADSTTLPGVRTYENELARLTVVGAVDFDQALTAAAVDGGETADEHIRSGSPAMVVETVFPGVGDDRSTVSTRLFLPASKVKEKAKKLKNLLNDSIMSRTSSQNILAMTFRQVVLEQLWNFEVVIFRSGIERNMEDLTKPREVPAAFTVSSSDESTISVLAEVVCLAALQSTERNVYDKPLGRTSNNSFNFFRKPGMISLKDMSVIIYMLEDGLVKNVRSLLEIFNQERANRKLACTNANYNWWTLSVSSKLTKIGGPEFSAWVREYVPAYKLQIDSDKLRNIKLEGWKNTSDNLWEVLLTHTQMVGLANILDMYYVDLYTFPNKELSCDVFTVATNPSVNKRPISFLKILSTVLVSALTLVTVSTMGQIYLPHLRNGTMHPGNHQLPKVSNHESIHQNFVDSAKKLLPLQMWQQSKRLMAGLGIL